MTYNRNQEKYKGSIAYPLWRMASVSPPRSPPASRPSSPEPDRQHGGAILPLELAPRCRGGPLVVDPYRTLLRLDSGQGFTERLAPEVGR